MLQSITRDLRQLYLSCEIAHKGKSLIAIFQNIFASINKNLILEGRMRTRLTFY